MSDFSELVRFTGGCGDFACVSLILDTMDDILTLLPFCCV